MTLRFLDLTLLFKLVSLESKIGVHEGRAISKEKSWFKQLRLMMARSRQRRQLLSLSDHQLEDIGLTQAQVLEEARKPFWVA